jgi:thermolabile hemolysin
MKFFKLLKILLGVYWVIAYGLVVADSHTILADNFVTNNKPDPEFDNYLSPNGPEISIDELVLIQQKKERLKKSDTYTYVRCYYAKDSRSILNMDTTSPESSYVWAKQKGSYYKLAGYWYSSGLLAWKNMFYTDVKLSTIRQICNETVNQNTNANFSFDQYAADNRFSFNHTVWQNDDFESNDNRINKLISFGDSLSDTNNMYNASQWKLPHNSSWFQGRFSNGRVWTEYLAQDLNLPLYNWAIGGAAGDTKYLLLSGLKQEVQSWVEYMEVAKNYNPNQSLFTILIGANDLVNYNRSVSDITQDLRSSLNLLAGHGAQNILLLNLPDVSVAPVFYMGKTIPNIQQQVKQYNKNILEIVSELQQNFPQINIQVFDTYQMFNDALVDYSSYGITNIFDPCLDINKDRSLDYILSYNPRISCKNGGEFMFWDGMHITTKIHRILANKILESIDASNY